MSLYSFGYYGGKKSHLNFILPYLPYRSHYVEPFAGSAAVLLAREPSGHEHFNDVDDRIWNFFTVLREQPEELIDAIDLTPYSVKEFEKCKIDEGDPIERARRFYAAINQSVHGQQGNWSKRFTSPRGYLPGGWYHRTTSKTYERLRMVSSRLRSVHLHCTDAVEIIKKFKHDDVVLYADPPYVVDSLVYKQPYKYTMNNEDHENLSKALHEFPGYAAISGYECELMDNLYRDWHKVKGEYKVAASGGTEMGKKKTQKQEILWINEKPSQPCESARRML